MDKITIKESEYNELLEKAAKWDRLGKKIEEYYAEDAKGDLTDIGEEAAIAYGWL